MAVSTSSLFANPVLDLLESSSVDSDLFPKYFEEKEEKPEDKKQAEEDRKLKMRNTPSQFPERTAPRIPLYKDDSNPYFQEVVGEGELNFRGMSGKASEDSDYSNDTSLTLTLGVAARVLNQGELEARVMLDHDGYQGIERFRLTLDVLEHTASVHNAIQRGLLSLYNGLRTGMQFLEPVTGELLPEASLNEIESAHVRFGKYRPRFGSQYTTDPVLRLTPYLSQMVEQIAPANALGAQYMVRNDYWSVTTGLFASEESKHIPVGGPGMFHLGVGYNFGTVDLSRDKSIQEFRELRADYYRNFDGEDSEVVDNNLEHLLALSFLAATDDTTLYIDALMGNGPDLTTWGLNITGGYWLKQDFLQLVGMYQHSNSDKEDGLSVNWGVPGALAQTTQASNYNASFQRNGSAYHALYGGMNMYLQENRCRLGLGVEYRTLEEADGEKYGSWMGQCQAVYTF